MLIGVSLLSFAVIQLPPGDFLSARVAELATMGATEEYIKMEIAALEGRYGLGQPIYVQYYKWMKGILTRGDFGDSFQWEQPVTELIWGRLSLTLVLSAVTTLCIWAVAFPVGIFSAVNQYSFGDYFATFLGFIGVAIPNFLLALVLMYLMFKYFGMSVSGLFSPEYIEAPWSWAKVWDLIKHLWIPVIILGTSGTAGLIRTMRANLLDELNKPYVNFARAKGLSEFRLLIKYPVRAALNPFVSGLAWLLPRLVSGSAIVSIVLNLPTTGPLLLSALRMQDMYLAGSFILMLSVLTVFGTLISDILLAWIDPRIRHGLG
jgi:peptide/nickel transport system permease protein